MGLLVLGKYNICCPESPRKRKISTRFVCVKSGLREFPEKKKSLVTGSRRAKVMKRTNKGSPLVLGYYRLCGRKTGNDIITRKDLAVDASFLWNPQSSAHEHCWIAGKKGEKSTHGRHSDLRLFVSSPTLKCSHELRKLYASVSVWLTVLKGKTSTRLALGLARVNFG